MQKGAIQRRRQNWGRGGFWLKAWHTLETNALGAMHFSSPFQEEVLIKKSSESLPPANIFTKNVCQHLFEDIFERFLHHKLTRKGLLKTGNRKTRWVLLWLSSFCVSTRYTNAEVNHGHKSSTGLLQLLFRETRGAVSRLGHARKRFRRAHEPAMLHATC